MSDVSDQSVPLRRSDLVAVEADGQLLVHYPGLPDTISLNTSAHAILDMCDGTRTVEQLSHELAEESGYPLEVLTADVKVTLVQLNKFGVVTLEVGGQESRDDSSA